MDFRIVGRFIIIALTLSSFLYASRVSVHESRSEVISERIRGIGGSSVAAADGKDVLFQNPALLYKLSQPNAKKGYGKYVNENNIFVNNDKIYRDNWIDFSVRFSTFFIQDREAFGSLLGYFDIADSIGSSGMRLLSFLGINIDEDVPPISKIEDWTYEDVVRFSESLKPFLSKEMSIGATLAFGPYVFNRHFASILTVDSQTDFRIKYGGILPYIGMDHKTDTAITTAFSTKVPSFDNLYFGVSLKAFHRVSAIVEDEDDFFDLIENYPELISYFDGSSDTLDGARSQSFTSMLLNGFNFENVDPFRVGFGIGTDVGFLWEMFRWLRFGLVVEDLISGVKWWGGDTSYIKSNLKVGTAILLPYDIPGLIDNITFVLDFDDLFFRKYGDFALKSHMGGRFNLFDDLASVYFGLNRGYPTFAVDSVLNFAFLKYTPILKTFYVEEYYHLLPRLPFPLSTVTWIATFPNYIPVFIPLNGEDLARFPRENFLVWTSQYLLQLVFQVNLNLSFGIYGDEAGERAGDKANYQAFFKLGIFYEY